MRRCQTQQSISRLASDLRGQIALMFAICGPLILIAVGSGLDLGRAYLVGQQLNAVATLTCQFANRPIVVQKTYGNAGAGGGAPAYTSQVNAYLNSALASQNIAYSQTTPTPFTFTPGGPANVTVTATVPTTLMNVVGIKSVPTGASVHCFDKPPNAAQVVADPSATLVVNEGFENAPVAGATYAWYNPNGSLGANATPTTAPTSQVGYVGTSGSEWLITGYCLEVDGVGEIEATVPQGTHSAELDCDNGSGTKGNSSISTKVYLQAQSYELRWNYVSRVDDPKYSPAYICGSAAVDSNWANDVTYTPSMGTRTNQINVYLDANPSSGLPPTHSTLDSTQTLAGTNLIDECVFATNWVERSVIITVTSAGYYWLSFAADGTSDAYGGQIDNIRLCKGTCTGAVQDNFPANWLNQSGPLFEDTFEAPVQAAYPAGYPTNTNGNLNTSYGSSGPAGGWPEQALSGWTTAPTNDALYWLSGAEQGNQDVGLGGVAANKNTSRSFLLDPGFYQVKYYYRSSVSFTSLSGIYCGQTPSAANYAALTGSTTWPGIYTYNGSQSAGNLTHDTNVLAVFMSHAQMASAPVPGAGLNATTTFINPDGSSSTSPAVPPNAINLAAYNPAQVNPLLDLCGYSATWQFRSRYIRILKPAFYWLNFASLGTVNSAGGSGTIDDVTLTAIGSPSMQSPPSSYVTIPVPDPQVHASINFSGFSIMAEAQNQ